MQLAPRAFEPSTARSFNPHPTRPRLGEGPEMWQVPALDSAGLLINAEEPVGGRVRAHTIAGGRGAERHHRDSV